ncbi:septal ring lytic transglycosylase RlpA family protein [Nonomuraea bangladeshensis]|uniref:septal ring lytic transglycosylase RlpA family protein n=1 Tax=Nonomuraea bangladeshensis TaxID=404385 RepID=UPI003C2F52CA
MGQHSQKPFLTGRRRWTAVAAGAAVIATASASAYAAAANDDSAKRAATAAKPLAGTGAAAAKTPNEAGRQSSPKPLSPAPKPPAAANPNPTTAATSHPQATSPRTPTPQATRPDGTGSQGAEAAGASRATTAPSASSGKTSGPAALKSAKPVAKKPKAKVLSSGSCGASYYDEPQMTASGERFNPSAMTAAHKTLPLGSKVRVINPNNGRSVTVRINDRGPYVGGRCLDLSAAAFSAIGSTNAGVMHVKYQVLAR